MAINLGAAYVDIVPSTSNLARGIRDQLVKPAQESGRAAGSSFASGFLGPVSSLARSAASTITSAISSAGQAGLRAIESAATVTGAFVGASLFKGWDRATTIQDATAALTVSLGDASKAAKVLDDVLNVVRGTPFNLDQFAAAAQRMVGMGIEAKKVPLYLTAIGEAAATQGKRANEFADRLTTVFSQIATSGQVQLADVWRISDTGVNALAILANAFGTTRDDMKDMIKKGAVPAGKALDALAKGILEGSKGPAGATLALAGTMEQLRGTLSGAASGFGAATARFGASIITPLSGTLNEAFTAFAAVLDKLGAVISEKIGAAVESPGFQRFADWVRSAPDEIGRLLPKLREMGPALAPVAAALAALSLRGLSSALGPLGAVIPTVSPAVALFAGWVATNDELREAFGRLGAALADAGARIATALAPVAERFLPAFADVLAGVVTYLADHTIPAFAGLVEDGLGALSRWWDRNGDTVTDGFSRFGRVMSESVFPFLEKVGDVIWDKVLPAFRDIGAWVIDHEEVIVGFIAGVAAAIMVKLVPAVIAWGISMWQAAVATLAATWPFLALIAVVALAAAGLWWLWHNNRLFRQMLEGTVLVLGRAIDAIETLAKWLYEAAGAVDKLLDRLGAIPGVVAGIAGPLGSILAGGGSIVGSAIGGIGRIFGGIVGYDAGGVVPGPVGSPQLALVHGGETILPTHRTGFQAPARSSGDIIIQVTQMPGEDAVSAGVRELRWLKQQEAELQAR